MGAEVGSLGHTVAPHTPPISFERTDAFEDSSQCCGSGIRGPFLNPGSGISFFMDSGSEPELLKIFWFKVLKFLAN